MNRKIVDLDLIHLEPTAEQQADLNKAVVDALTTPVVLRLKKGNKLAVLIASVYYHIKAVCKTLADVQAGCRKRAVDDAYIKSFPVSLPVGLCGWVSRKT
jgi:hypothetical protein